MKKNDKDNIYTSRYIQVLENYYCDSRSAVTSACCSQSLPTRIINGGKKAIYTATMAAMLLNNALPAYADLIISAGETSTGLTAGAAPENIVHGSISNYGTTISTTLNSGGLEYILGGGQAYITDIHSGAYQGVQNGGVAYDTVVGGSQGVQSGGVAYNTVIVNGGRQGVYFTVASGTTISSGGEQSIAGGSAYNTIIQSGGEQNVTPSLGLVGFAENTIIAGGRQVVQGGSAISTTILQGGEQYIYHGSAANTEIQSGAHQAVIGGSATDTMIMGGIQNVCDNGIAYNTVVQDYGIQQAYFSGSSYDTIVQNGGLQRVWSDGVSFDTIISFGGTQEVLSNGSSYNTDVQSVGLQFVIAGNAYNTDIHNGGVQDISYSGIAFNTEIHSGGVQDVQELGLASDTIVNSGGKQNVYSGGQAYNTEVLGYGLQFVERNGSAFNTIIGEQGQQNVFNDGQAFDTVVQGLGLQWVSSNGTAFNTVIQSDGTQDVNGGCAFNTEVQNGGVQFVVESGSAFSTIVHQGGEQYVLLNGVASNTTIYNGSGAYHGGLQLVYSGGQAHNTVITEEGRGGLQSVYLGGVAYNTEVGWGGIQDVRSGGAAYGTIIHSGGEQEVYSAQVYDTYISKGGRQIIYWDTSAVRTTVENGGSQTVLGIAVSTVLGSAGRQNIQSSVYDVSAVHYVPQAVQNISSGGMAYDTIINNGGRQNISSGGSAFETDIYSGGAQYILGGGFADSTTVHSGGNQFVSSGGTAQNNIVEHGGNLHADSGAIINGVVVGRGGHERISSGAIDTNAIVAGMQEVLGGGTASHAIIQAAGHQLVSSGAIVNHVKIDKGGTQNILDGGSAFAVENSGEVSLKFGGILSDYSGDGSLFVQGDNTLRGATDISDGKLILENSTPSTLEVNSLSADNAVVALGVDLKDQAADTLVIQSSFDGDAKLALRGMGSVVNVSEDSIKLIDFEDGATINGTFELLGGQWDDGGYIYKMSQSTDDNDYYLRNTGDFSDVFKTMANMPALNAVVIKAGMNSLNKRMGDLRDMNSPDSKSGIWVRTYYKDATVKDLAKTDMSLFGVETGYDWLFNAEEPTKLFAGVMFGYMRVDSIKTKAINGDNNKGKGDAPSIGLYATLVNEDGWFIDLAARNFWRKIENTTRTAGDNILKFDSKRNIITGSLEIGKTFTDENGFKLEPKVELSYVNASKETAAVTGGIGNVEYDAENYLTGKAAVMFAYKTEMSDKLLIEPLLELAYNREFAGRGKVRYAGAETKTKLDGGSFEASVGLSMQLADNLYWHALGTYEKGNKLSAWGLNAGIRLGFGGSKKK